MHCLITRINFNYRLSDNTTIGMCVYVPHIADICLCLTTCFIDNKILFKRRFSQDFFFIVQFARCNRFFHLWNHIRWLKPRIELSTNFARASLAKSELIDLTSQNNEELGKKRFFKKLYFWVFWNFENNKINEKFRIHFALTKKLESEKLIRCGGVRSRWGYSQLNFTRLECSNAQSIPWLAET